MMSLLLLRSDIAHTKAKQEKVAVVRGKEKIALCIHVVYPGRISTYYTSRLYPTVMLSQTSAYLTA